MPPPLPWVVEIGIPALFKASMSRLIVLLETSKLSASSGAVVLSFCNRTDSIPISLSIFISPRPYRIADLTRQLCVMSIVGAILISINEKPLGSGFFLSLHGRLMIALDYSQYCLSFGDAGSKLLKSLIYLFKPKNSSMDTSRCISLKRNEIFSSPSPSSWTKMK